MKGTDGNGTLDFPAGDSQWDDKRGAIPHNDHAPITAPTFIVKKEQDAGGEQKNVCHKCGAICMPGENFCCSCGATLSKSVIVDMRHTLEERPRSRSSPGNGVEVQRMKTSYKSGVMSARREIEGISPIPMPDFPQLHEEQGNRERGKDSSYNIWLAASAITFIVIMIVVLILLIVNFL